MTSPQRERVRRLYVGIDIHSRLHKVALLPSRILENGQGSWRDARTLTIRNTAEDYARLCEAIESEAPNEEDVLVIVEHTGTHYSEPLVYFLVYKGYRVGYLESVATAAVRRRVLDQENKSDEADCAGFAFLGYLADSHGLSFRISMAVVPSQTSRAAVLRSLVLQRRQFGKLRVQATNRLHQYLLAVFPEAEARYFGQLVRVTDRYPTPLEILTDAGFNEDETLTLSVKAEIVDLARKTVGIPGQTYSWLIKKLSLERIRYFSEEKEISGLIHLELKSHPYTAILLSFPNLGEITAATLIGVIQDVNRYSNKKKFRKALGLYARLRQSGTGLAHSYPGREGSGDARQIMFWACLRCITKQAPDNDFRDYYMRQLSFRKPKIKAVVAASGKLAEVIYHCLLNNEPYRYTGIYAKKRRRPDLEQES